MASFICMGCDLYKPKNPRLLSRECAAFATCTECDCCGARIPPLPRNDPSRFSPADIQGKNTEPQALAEVEGY
ncbi:MAG: hypothetical protein VB087_09735 [Candidatus Limiplasma sp.]|nr:hypothetical protein [Candidatus Limiplasma sp.]